jgi:tight adherence protein B
MTPQATVLLATGGIFLLLAVAVLLLLPSGNSTRLRQRARGATGIAEKPVVGPKQSIRLAVAREGGLWTLMTAALGHNSQLPRAYAASVPLVSISSALIGLLLFWQARSSVGEVISGSAAILLALAAARFQFKRKTRIYAHLLFIQIADALSLVVRSVRAGLPVGDALRSLATEMPAPTSHEFARTMGEVALGVALDQAIWNLHSRTKVREYSFLAVTLGLHAQTGGNLGETLENLVDMVRRRIALAGKARALSSEARTSCSILAGLPFVTGLIVSAVDPAYMADLFYDPRGKNFLIVFAVLLSAGLLINRWLLQRATSD